MKTKAAIATAILIAAFSALSTTSALAQTAHTSVAPKTPGSIDSDIIAAHGKLLGYLHGDLTRKGTGLATFRPLPGNGLISLIVGLRAHRAGANSVVIAHGSNLHMRLVITPKKTISGRGKFGRRAVRLSGAAGEELPALKKGMKMLVVGRPSGEGYAALKTFFKPVRYNPRKHTRHNFLRERQEFRSYAALVFGAGISPHGIVTHKLLRAFYGASKWVIVAPATPAAQDALRDVHPYVPGTPSPLLAVRASGPVASARNVRPTVLYPAAVKVRAPASALRGAKRARVSWFIGQLRSLAAGHLSPAHKAQGSAPADFHVPANAAALEVDVSYYHEFVFSHPQNLQQYQPCAWNQTTFNAWCTDTWFWKQQSAGDLTNGCKYFLNNGYTIIDRPTVQSVTTTQNSDGAYPVNWGDFDHAFLQESGEDDPATACPTDGTQIGNVQGTDRYFVLYNDKTNEHTIVALTDPTINATTTQGARIWHDGGNNGGGQVIEHDLYGQPHRKHVDLPETAWFLGQYVNSVTLTENPPFIGNSLRYDGGDSFPKNDITFESTSQSQGTSKSFNVGIFGGQGTGGYTDTQSFTASVSVNVPSWKVSPVAGDRSVSYTWQTNTPVDWGTISGGGGGGFGLNDLNKAGFNPGSLSIWNGQATCCDVFVSSKSALSFVDHYTRVNADETGVEDHYSTQVREFNDTPNEILSLTDSPAGPGIDLCDPDVMAPGFLDQCKGQGPAPILSVLVSCQTAPASTTPYTISIQGQPVGGPLKGQTVLFGGGTPIKTFNCPNKLPARISPIELKPNTAATLSEDLPHGLGMDNVFSCFKGSDTQSFLGQNTKGDQASVTISGNDLPRGAVISCMIINKPPG